jgi:hypothetical protein
MHFVHAVSARTEVFITVVINSTAFWDIMSCSPANLPLFRRNFGEVARRHIPSYRHAFISLVLSY